ncbi:Uncharacterised protein [Escherichia coli]|uniref:Uncharacterized protein n=1 Tax=Escherichia coli TaxID=562 RepID=A0A376L200_ECOLX|nr:Uncharacterised protein [Escherichia coli]
MLEGWLLFESRKRRPNLILRQLNPDKHHRAMRFFIAPWPVPVGAVEALDALEQQAVRFAVNPQHPFVTQQFIRRFQQQVFHHPGNFADIYRVIQFHHNRRNIVLFVRDKMETRFGADDVFFQHKNRWC